MLTGPRWGASRADAGRVRHCMDADSLGRKKETRSTCSRHVATANVRRPTRKTKGSAGNLLTLVFYGRGGGIRTRDPLHPIRVKAHPRASNDIPETISTHCFVCRKIPLPFQHRPIQSNHIRQICGGKCGGNFNPLTAPRQGGKHEQADRQGT